MAVNGSGHFMTAAVLSLCVALVAPVPIAGAAEDPGGLDPTFGTGGKVITDFGPSGGPATALAIQADGKIVVAGGRDSGFALARYNSNGSLDTTFDADGKVITSFGGSIEPAHAVVIQADGKIVAAGSTNAGASGSQWALARYNGDGSLDTTFDADGKVLTAWAPLGASQPVFALAVQADGRIVAGGAGSNTWALARYNADGSLDTTFDSDGIVTTPLSGYVSSLAIQADGRIVAGGSSGFTVARYNTNGSLDTAFETDGIVTTVFAGAGGWANAVAIQGDGKIVAAGGVSKPQQHLALARYNANGSLDTSFDADGKATLPGFEFASDMAIQQNGKIVAVGYAWRADPDFALARFDSDGRLDGLTTTDFGGSDSAQAVAIQADGKIVAAGRGGSTGWALARYTGITPIKELSATPAAIDFGAVFLGSPRATATVTVTNPSSSTDVTISLVTLAAGKPGGVSITSQGCPAGALGPKASCDIDLAFAPVAAGSVTAELRVTSNAEASPLVVPIRGTGVDPVEILPATLAFGLAYEDTADTTLTTTLANDGAVPVTVTSVAISGAQAADFAVRTQTCTGKPVAAHGSCSMTVGFKPTAPGGRVATLTVTGPFPMNTRTVSLTGTGLLDSPSLLALEAGEYVTCAIRSDGTLACWGDTEAGQTTPPSGEFLAVSLGWPYACGIRADETLVCWSNAHEPWVTSPTGTFTAVEAGHGGNCAIRTDGTLACWRNLFADVPTGAFTDVAVGWRHACAIRTDGTLACWGDNGFGQARPPTGTFIDVGAGSYHTCGIRSAGTLACWGANDNGAATPPTGTFSALSTGDFHSCAVRTNGTLACWGNNNSGEASVPPGTFLAVSAGTAHTCGIWSDGSVGCWGWNTHGEATVFPTATIKGLPTWLATTAVPLSWSATPTLAPIDSYDVRYRRAKWNGGFGSRTTWRLGTRDTSATFPASRGYTYCFQIRAHDAEHYASPWTSETCTAIPLDDRAFTRSGRWAARTGSAYYAGTYVRSSTRGARLARTGVVAKRIALLATTCPTCGTVKVYWGSTLLRKISLYSATTVNKKLIPVKTFTTRRTGTLKIVVISSGRKVIIDGVAIRRN